MANSDNRFLTSGLAALLFSGFIGCLTVVVLKDAWERDRQRATVLNGIMKADVSETVCPGTAPRPDLTLTLAPLLTVQDRMSETVAQDWIKGALAKDLSFAFCPLAQGTTSFEVVRDQAGRDVQVLKLNSEATDLQQQAAVLQFLKEFSASSVGLAHNNKVTADPRLTAAMPGRLPSGTDLSRGVSRAERQVLTIPAR